MATINLGAIKFNWKGAYNSGTTYAVDDVVSSGGNSYVCIQAHSNQAVGDATAYWNIMSSAGTNGTDGTDLTSTLSTRGDIVYKGASALNRLPKGTSGYFLKQGANDPEWGAVDLTNLSATNLTSGTIPNARYGTPTFSGANLTNLPVSSDVVKIATTTISGNPGEVGFKISSLSGGVLDFSTYRKFELQFEDVSHNHSSNYSNFYGRFFDTSGNAISSSNYNFAFISKMQDNGSLYNNEGGEQTEFRMSRDYVGAQSQRGVTGTFNIFGSMASTSTWTKTDFDFNVTNHDNDSKHERTIGFANYESTSALGGVNFYWNQGNFRNGGKITVIGYK
jgi:hypothetical protein